MIDDVFVISYNCFKWIPLYTRVPIPATTGVRRAPDLIIDP